MNIEFVNKLNAYGQQRTPFFFVVDYKATHFFAQPLATLDDDILFRFENHAHYSSKTVQTPIVWSKKPLSKELYLPKVRRVIEEIKAGNTYLLNLTAPTNVECNASLEEIFYATNAAFKLCFKEEFVCFSPERFVKIENNIIETHPMKGTIDANIPNAKERILSDEKEMAEHVMVVDLLRNDLSMVAKNVRVESFRYVESIHAGDKELLQVSSKITGTLDESWHDGIGTLLMSILPAGSITGTPKKKCTELIEAIEGYERGFYTGVFGMYDGKSLDSAVMIRFIEKNEEGYLFKSGGGITLLSDPEKEYKELCDKVYIPLS